MRLVLLERHGGEQYVQRQDAGVCLGRRHQACLPCGINQCWYCRLNFRKLFGNHQEFDSCVCKQDLICWTWLTKTSDNQRRELTPPGMRCMNKADPFPCRAMSFMRHITNSYTVAPDVHTEQTVRLSECLSTARRV